MAHHWEQVNAVQFCARLGKSPAETHDMLLQAYQQDALRKVAAKAYYSRFQKKGNSLPATYGRKSQGYVKKISNRKLFCDTGDSNSGDFQSDGGDGQSDGADGHSPPRCVDINLHLQWDNDDSNDVDKNPSNSKIKNFLNSIESSCNEHMKPQKMSISTNHEDVQVEEVDDQTVPEKSEEDKPIHEVNEDSAQEDTVSSSIPTHETVVTTKKTTRETTVETSKTMVTKRHVATPRTTRSKCRCPTCRLKM